MGVRRRKFLKTAGAAAAGIGVAGCSQTEDGGDETDTRAYTDTSRSNGTESATETKEELEGWEKVASILQENVYEEAHSNISLDAANYRVNDYEALKAAREVAEEKHGITVQINELISSYSPEDLNIDRTDDVYQIFQFTTTGVGNIVKNSNLSEIEEQDLEGDSFAGKEGEYFMMTVNEYWAALNPEKELFLSAVKRGDVDVSDKTEINKMKDVVEGRKDSQIRNHPRVEYRGGKNETAIEYVVGDVPRGSALGIPDSATIEEYTTALVVNKNGLVEKQWFLPEDNEDESEWYLNEKVRREPGDEGDYAASFENF